MAMKGCSAFPQSSRITGTSSSDCLVSYPGHSLVESYLSADVHSYSTAPADWTKYSSYFYSLSTSSLGRKALCIVICWNSLVHFENGPMYLMRLTAQVLSLLFHCSCGFYTSIGFWSFTGVKMAVSLLRSPELVSVQAILKKSCYLNGHFLLIFTSFSSLF